MALAFLGDSVYEVMVREYLLRAANQPAAKLHDQKVQLVCAGFQAAAADRLLPVLTENETGVYKRGRNANNTVPRHTSAQDYHKATGLEALFGYLHLSNALYTADPARAAESYRLLCAEAQADLADNNAYWKQWEGPVRETGEKVYTTFLQGYGQTLGMRSYGACVDLLVEEFLPNTTAGD